MLSSSASWRRRRLATGTAASVVVLIVVVMSCCCASEAASSADAVPQRPRGVEPQRAALYEPAGAAGDQFVCLDGSRTIKYEQINDDYCDCADASDEPGTAACPHGHFHCPNAGHRPLRLPSSRVNDGICDCCDASDEYADATRCTNTCSERGQADRVRDHQRAELARAGSVLRAEMAQRGQARKAEQDARLAELRASHAEARRLHEEQQAQRTEAERLETLALDAHRAVAEAASAERRQLEAAADEREALAAFRLLDADGDGEVTLAEVRARATFDRNRDGEVSEEEALGFLGQYDLVNERQFVEYAWPLVKPYVMLEAAAGAGFEAPLDAEAAAAVPTEEPRYDDEHEDAEEEERLVSDADQPTTADHNDDNDDAEEEGEEEEEYLDDEEAETGEGTVEAVQRHSDAADAGPLVYDTDTQLAVDQANEARRLADDADRQVRDIESEISGIEQRLEKDYGRDEEYAALHGECFEYEDREYVYKVCPFDRAAQQSRGGGGETRLGAWERWAGPPENPYAAMQFTNGAQCWNGPQRSALVHLECGLETKVLSVAEPNRCEYVCTMQTPAACSLSDTAEAATSASGGHDEL